MIYRRVLARLRAQGWMAIATTGRPTVISATRDIRIELALAHASTDALRAHPKLVGQLNHHRAMIATYQFNVDRYAVLLRDVARRLAFREGGQ